MITRTKPLSFANHIRHKDGTYASFEMSDESKLMLDNFLNMTLDLPVRTDPDTYHTTVIYSKTPVPKAELYTGIFENRDATPIGWEVFPTKNDGKCLVLRIVFPHAEHLNKTFAEMGATSDYTEYKPHVTVAYDFKEDIDPAELSLPHFPLTFKGLSVAPLEPDYVPPNKES